MVTWGLGWGSSDKCVFLSAQGGLGICSPGTVLQRRHQEALGGPGSPPTHNSWGCPDPHRSPSLPQPPPRNRHSSCPEIKEGPSHVKDSFGVRLWGQFPSLWEEQRTAICSELWTSGQGDRAHGGLNVMIHE